MGRRIALLFHDRGTRRGWVVSSTPRPYFTHRYPFYRRLGGPQGLSGRAENLAPLGFDFQTVQSVVSCYTDWATRPTLCLHAYPQKYTPLMQLYLIRVPSFMEAKCSTLLYIISVVWASRLSLFLSARVDVTSNPEDGNRDTWKRWIKCYSHAAPNYKLHLHVLIPNRRLLSLYCTRISAIPAATVSLMPWWRAFLNILSETRFSLRFLQNIACCYHFCWKERIFWFMPFVFCLV